MLQPPQTPADKQGMYDRPLFLPTSPPRVAVLAVHHLDRQSGVFAGGAEKYLRSTIASLVNAGAVVRVNHSGPSIYDDIAARHSLVLERTDWLDENLGSDRRLRARCVAARYRWFERHRPDVAFVVQQGNGGAFGASIVAARLAGCRVVASIRQPPPVDGTDSLLTPTIPLKRSALRPRFGLWRRRLVWRMRTVAACCDVLIFNSRRVADEYQRRYTLDPRRIRVIPNAESAAALPRSQAGLHREPIHDPAGGRRTVIGTLGRVSRGKGADVLLAAFAHLAGRRVETTLAYYGDGPLVATLREQAAALGLADRVHLYGHTSDAGAALANIDVFVLPSRWESSSNAVLEAMARGLPCVVSDVGGLPELVADRRTGLVVPSEDVAALAHAIERLVAQPAEAARLGDAAYAQVQRHHDPAAVRRATLEAILGTGWMRWTAGDILRAGGPAATESPVAPATCTAPVGATD